MNVLTHPVVLVGVDGSPNSIVAVELAAAEAERRHQPLRLVCGHEAPLFVPTPATHAESALDPLRTMLAEITETIRAAHPRLEVSADVVEGHAASVLITASAGASLLVVGGRGNGGFHGMLTGSVATQVAAHASCPVIVVRTGVDASTRRAQTHPVVLGVDRGDRSARAIAFAFEEAAARGVSLTAIHVWVEPPSPDGGPFRPVVSGYDEAQSEAARMLAESLAGYQEKYPEVPVFREIVCGLNPAHELLGVTPEAGLVVVGSRGHGGFTGLLLGSVSQALMHHAACPVAIVHGDQ